MGTEVEPSSAAEEAWVAECSDTEEKYNPSKIVPGAWEPLPEDIIRLYTCLAAGEIPELEWECPDRRSPSPLGMEQDDAEDESEPMEEPKEEK